MDELENFDETSLPEKEEFYSNLIMEDITDVDYMDAKRVCKDFDPSQFISAPGFAWQTVFKKTEVKLELLSEIDILLMVEKGIRGEMCNSIKRYAKANNKYTNI